MSRRKQHQPQHHSDTDPETTPEQDISVRRKVCTADTHTEQGARTLNDLVNHLGDHLLPGSGLDDTGVDFTQDIEIIKDRSATNPGIADKAELPPTNQTPLEYHKKLYLRAKALETSYSIKGVAKPDPNTFSKALPDMESPEWRRAMEDHSMDHELDDCQARSEGNEEVFQDAEGKSCQQVDRNCSQKDERKRAMDSFSLENSSGIVQTVVKYKEVIEPENTAPEADAEDDDEEAFGLAGSGHCVKLETLKNTSVAVAQIVENNLPSADMMPSLMQTVYGLWQQQMMQCHMLEVVRQHLVKIAKDKNIPLPSLPITSNNEELAYTTHPDDSGRLGTSSCRNSDSTSPVSQDVSELDEEETKLLHYPDSSKAMTAVRHSGKVSVYSSSEQPKPSTMGVTSPSTAAEVPSQFVRNSGNKLDVGTALDRSQYAADDPLFRHKCRFCDKIFGSDSALQIHVRSHTGERPYECDVCNSKFSTRGNLKVHYEGHLLDSNLHKTNRAAEGEHTSRPSLQRTSIQDTKPYSPSLPPFTSSSSNFTFPPSADTANKTEVAAKDPLSYISPTSVQATAQDKHHFQLMSSTSPMVGQMPPMSFPRPPPMMSSFSSPPSSLGPRSASLGGMPPPPPPPPQFMRSSILPQQNEEDDALEQYMEVTKSETSKLEAMVKNIETKLTDPNQCIICKRILSCKSALQMHYRTHTGERPFRCKICGRSFTTKGNLKTHMGVHRLKPPVRAMHQCPVCQKQFTNAVVLQQHMQSYHSDVRQMLRPGFPGMMPPNSMFPHFGGLPMMPNFMDKMSPFSPFSSMNGDDHSRYGRTSDHEFSDYEDFDEQSDVEADFSDMADTSVKRTEMAEDEMSYPGSLSSMKRPKIEEELVYPESLSDTKKPKVEYEQEDATDDEEVPLQEEKDQRLTDTSTPKLSDKSYDRPLLPQSLASETFPYTDYKNDSSDYSAMSITEDVMKTTDESNYQPEMKHFTEEIQSKLEAGNRVPFSSGYTNEDSNCHRNMVSPIGSSASASYSDRNTPRISTPGTTTPPQRTQLSPMGFSTHSLNFAAGRPGYFTTCDLCFKTFACKSALSIHYRSHTKEKPFRCGLCDRGFSTKGNLKQHYLTHKLRELQEAGIDTSRANEDDYNDHHIAAEVAATSQQQHQMQHQMQHLPPHLPPHESNPSKVSPDKPEGGYQPNDSKRETSLRDTVPASLQQPFPRLPHSPAYPIAHSTEQARPINPVQPLQRDQREMDYLQAANLKHQCQVCHKPFSSASALQIHMRTHTGERPFKCMECNKGFTTKGNLKVHMSIHDDRTNFTRRGRRMALDGFPRFEGLPLSMGLPGFPSPGLFHPPKGTPDLFMPRFPFMALPRVHHSGFMGPRPNEIPVIQASPNSRPLQISSPLGKPKFSLDDPKEQPDLKRLREVSQAS